jgi:phage protein D
MLSKKYSNFYAPTNRIFVNGDEALSKKNKAASNIVVEETLNEPSKFNFTVDDDSQLFWVNGDFFPIGATIQIKAGYANVLETLITAPVESVKTVFSSIQQSQMIVAGETKPEIPTISAQMDTLQPITIDYGRLLLDFTSETSVNKNLNYKSSNILCSGKCVGLPDLKPGSIIKIVGLGTKFSQTCTVSHVIHTIGGSGYSTTFDAYAQPERPVRPNKPVIKTLKDRQIQMG